MEGAGIRGVGVTSTRLLGIHCVISCQPLNLSGHELPLLGWGMILKVPFRDRILGMILSSEKSAKLHYKIIVGELSNIYGGCPSKS